MGVKPINIEIEFDLGGTGYTVLPIMRDSPINWQAGDLACCIDGKGWRTLNGTPTKGPEVGEIRKVKSVSMDYAVQWLELEGWTGQYSASCFTKVPPREEEVERKAKAPAFDFRRLFGPKVREKVDA